MNDLNTAPQPKAKYLPAQILIFGLTRAVFNTLHRMVYPYLPVFGRGLGVSLETMARVITLRSVIGAVGPLLGAAADQFSRKLSMLAALGLFIAGGFLVMIFPTLPGFVLGLLLTMMGKYLFDPAMQAYLGDRIPYQRRGRALAITEIGWSLAFIAGVPLAGYLIGRFGWQAPFPVFAGLGLAAFLALLGLLPGESSPSAPVENRAAAILSRLVEVVRYPPALAGLMIGVGISLSNEVVNLVFGVWMEGSFGLQIAGLGATAAVIGISEMGAEGLVGVFVDRLGKVRAVGLGLFANSVAALLLPLLGQSMGGALAGLFFFYFSFEFTLVSSIPLMTEIMPGARATLMAVNVSGISLGRAVGALLATPLYTWGIIGNAGATAAINLLVIAVLVYLRRKLPEE